VVIRTYIERWPCKGRPPEKVLVIVVEPDEETRDRCPRCGQRGKPAEYDVVRWRTLDVHGKRTFLESRVPRITCGQHGKITAAAPWARPDDRFSRPFEEFAAWKAAHAAWTRVCAELRITWDALANITARVAADAWAGRDRLDGLAMIGIDEKSWGKGQDKYLMIVTDHQAGQVAWIGEGRCQDTVRAFFDQLGPARSKLLTHVSADGAEWIHDVIREKAPQAKITLDAFHIVKWAGEAVDELRRRIAAELRAAGKDDQAATLGKGMRAVRKDYRKLSPGQRGSLAVLAADNKAMYKGYLIKEQLREAIKVKGEEGKTLLRGMISWAHRFRIPEFKKLATTLSRMRDMIDHTLDGGPSNGRAEAMNAQVNAMITRARGFRSATAL
ncbi:MAG: ISL3 family transposase, partial [Streptosporangiaceae bacterium]